MRAQHKLSEVWIKASILGTLWASSEIVFGSFLHNLKVPFSGNLLTAIGIILLISVSYIWKERGLFLRAGLITAILKTMSPSAVIFGPMMAILAEAAILEVSIMILGRTMAGYLFGAALAMSWNLFQKIINYIIFYGYNIVELYKQLIEIAEAKLSINIDSAWLPVFLLLAVYIVFGIISGLMAMRIGRHLLKERAVIQISETSKKIPGLKDAGKTGFIYSLSWFYLNIILIIGSLVIISITDWIIWVITTVVVVAIWTLRYKRAFRQIARPKFWISFVIITTLIALVFSKEMSIGERLITGVQMNFRAAIIILGFTVMGTELYNPKIRDFLNRGAFKQLSVALELSFESLPSSIASIPDVKTILKNPFIVLYQIVSQVESRLNEMKNVKDSKVFIVSGGVGEGKTKLIRKIVNTLQVHGSIVDGIYSTRLMEDRDTIGYDVVDIKTEEREKFLRLDGKDSYGRIGKYYICPSGLIMGNDVLKASILDDNDLIVIDEVGNLELNDRGWADCLNKMFSSSQKNILLSVRDTFVEEIIEKWNLKHVIEYDIKKHDSHEIANSLLSFIRK